MTFLGLTFSMFSSFIHLVAYSISLLSFFDLPWKIWNRKLDSTTAGLFCLLRCHFVNKPHSSGPGPIRCPCPCVGQCGGAVCMGALLGQLVVFEIGLNFFVLPLAGS